MSVTTTAALNYQLTTFAQGHWNDIRDVVALAERLAPTTPVPGATGQFKKFDDKNSFMPVETARALGGDPAVITFSATDDSYNCTPQALEVRVDKRERELAGSQGGELANQLLDEGKIRALLNKTALSHVKAVADFVLASVTAQSGVGNWTNTTVDPIDEIDAQLDAIAKDVGSTQNIKLTLDVTAWRLLRANAKVKSRASGVQVGFVTQEQLVAMLLFPVDLMVANVVYDANKLGQTADKKRVLQSVALIHYSVPNPTLYDPSAFKTFTVGNGSPVSGVRSYTAPNGLWDGHIIDWSRDIKQTSSLAMRRIDVS